MNSQDLAGSLYHMDYCYELESDVATPIGKSTAVVAEESIRFKVGTKLKARPNSSLLFKIDTLEGIRDTLLEPLPPLQVVGQFEKAEFGIQLDSMSEALVSNFLGGNSPQLNPYDPRDIDVMGHFWHWNGTQWEVSDFSPKQRPGFFIPSDFERKAETDPDFESNDPGESWNALPISERFRVRFSPRKTGLWRYRFEIRVDSTYHVHTPFKELNCVPSPSEDFVRLDSFNRYLKVGNRSFFPIGHNLAWPKESAPVTWGVDKMVSASGFKLYNGRLDSLSTAGANYVRMIMAPWATELEFERLGDYAQRMPYAWEMDRIIEHCSTLDLKIHLNMQVHYPYELPSRYYFFPWDWSKASEYPWCDSCVARSGDQGYAYYSDPLLNLSTPTDFLRDSLARLYYKNRLRYIVARYGYSPQIAILELLSEVNNVGTQISYSASNSSCAVDSVDFIPNEQDSLFPSLLFDWQREMCDYIKQELLHTDHLLTINYTGSPNDRDTVQLHPSNISPVYGDSSYYMESIDLWSMNKYDAGVSPTANYDANFKFSGEFGKPMFVSEGGNSLESITWCDYGCRFIKNTVLGAFSGGIGSPLNWTNQVPAPEWHVFGYLKDFLNTHLPDTDLLESYYDFNATRTAEVFSLVKDNFAIGVVNNRTVNYYSLSPPQIPHPVTGNTIASPCRADPNGLFQFPGIFADLAQGVQILPTSLNGNSRLEVELPLQYDPLLPLVVRYYNIYGGLVHSQTLLPADYQNNKVELQHPLLETNLLNSFYLFTLTY